MSISTVKSASLVPAKWHPRFSRFQPRQAAGHIGLYRTYLTEVNGKNGGVLSTLKKWKKMFACQYYPRILAKVVWKNQWFYASINQWRKDETNSRIFTPTAVQFITYFDGATWVKLTIVPRHQYQDWLWDTFFLPLFSSFNVGLASKQREDKCLWRPSINVTSFVRPFLKLQSPSWRSDCPSMHNAKEAKNLKLKKIGICRAKQFCWPPSL